MADENSRVDQNQARSLIALTSSSEIRNLKVNAAGELLTSFSTGGSAGGTVTANQGIPAAQSAAAAWPVGLVPLTTAGVDPYSNISLDSTGQVVKATPGQLYSYYLYNGATNTRFFKLYDKATAPTSTDTPKWVLPVPAGAGANLAMNVGLGFTAGIGVRATTAITSTSTGDPAANECVINLGYK